MSISKARRTPGQDRSRQKVAAILAAARRLLEEEGAEAFNTNRVALEAGIGVGSLYEYFPNKEAIAMRLIDELAESEAAEVLAAVHELESDDLRVGIRAVVEVAVRLYGQHHELYGALWSLTRVTRPAGQRPGERQITTAVKALLANSKEPLRVLDLERTVFTCFHLVEALASRFAEATEVYTEREAIDEITAVLTCYLFNR